jgi:hypothetical protein
VSGDRTVSPHGFERDARGGIVEYDIRYFVDVLPDVSAAMPPGDNDIITHPHSVSTMVVSEAPIWHHGTMPDDFGILLRHLRWRRTGKEIEVEDSAQDILETNSIIISRGVRHVWVHRYGDGLFYA